MSENAPMSVGEEMDQPIKHQVEKVLRETLSPVYMEVVNESDQHSVPKGSETHFKVTLVSEQFDQKRLVARHQLVYKVLASLLNNPIHALALHTYTQAEWSQSEGSPDSPQCLGGSKHD